MTTPGDVLREILLPKLEGIRKSGGSYMARCPAHDDNQASLSITEGKEHPVVLNCKAGCETDGHPRQDRAHVGGPVQATGERDQASGRVDPLRRGCRGLRLHGRGQQPAVPGAPYDRTSSSPQRVPDRTRKSGYRWKLGDTRRVLYRLPKIIEAVKDGEIIWVVEGEKDVHSLERAGVVATCNPGGRAAGGATSTPKCSAMPSSSSSRTRTSPARPTPGR